MLKKHLIYQYERPLCIYVRATYLDHILKRSDEFKIIKISKFDENNDSFWMKIKMIIISYSKRSMHIERARDCMRHIALHVR
jgi:hypothetical protein